MSWIKYFFSALMLLGTTLFLMFVGDVIAKKYLGLANPLFMTRMHYGDIALGKIVSTKDLMETSLQ